MIFYLQNYSFLGGDKILIVGAISVGGSTKEQDLEIANFIVAKFHEMNVNNCLSFEQT